MKERKKEQKFNLVSFIFKLAINLLFSPIVFLVIGYFLFKDIEKAVLLTLYALTFMTTVKLFFNLISIFISSITLNLINIVKKLADALVSIIVVVIYWALYLVVMGGSIYF